MSGFLQATGASGARDIGSAPAGSPPVAAALYVVGNIGGVGAWLTGPGAGRLRDRARPLLPAGVRTGPSPWQTPYVAHPHPGGARDAVPLPLRPGEGDHGREGVSDHPRHDAAGLLHPLPLPVRLLPGRCGLQEPRRRRVAPGTGAARRAGDRARPASCFTLFAMVIATIPPTPRRSRALPAQGLGGAAALRRRSAGSIYWRGRGGERSRSSSGHAASLAAARGSAIALRHRAVALARRSARPSCQQIKVRHPYYYREMFIPQVTSGPSAAPGRPTGASWSTRCRARSGASGVGSDRGPPAHRRPGLRLPARLVARRPPDRLRLLPATTRSSFGCSTSAAARPRRSSPTAR